LESSQVDVVQLFAVQAAVALGYRRARQLVQELLLVSDRERIARDLHDSVIQRLFAVGLTLEAAARLPRADIGERLHQAVTDIDDTIRSIRTAIFGLEPRTGKVPGLRRQVLDLTVSAAPSLGFEPSVRFTGPVDSLATGRIAEHLLAVLREALSNIARHARAHHVEVTVAAADDFTLTVDDDGVGQPGVPGVPHALHEPREPTRIGHGLKNMAERAKQLGGTMAIGAREPAGTRVTWRVPRRLTTNQESDLRP
jgi:signal transduction histidine kinase